MERYQCEPVEQLPSMDQAQDWIKANWKILAISALGLIVVVLLMRKK